MQSAARWVRTAMVAAVFAAGGPAGAQSVYGPGGLLLNPTASFPPEGQITPAILVIPTERPSVGRRTWVSYSLAYGLSDRWEVAVTHLKINPGGGAAFGGSGSTGASAKYRVVEGRPGGRPDVAVGGGFLTGGDNNASIGYVALRFSPRRQNPRHPVYLHTGLLYAGELNGYPRDDVAVYGGVEVGLVSNLALFGEIRTEMDAKSALASDVRPPSAIGLVWRAAPSLKLVVAMANNGTSSSHKASVGIGYSIGMD